MSSAHVEHRKGKIKVSVEIGPAPGLVDIRLLGDLAHAFIAEIVARIRDGRLPVTYGSGDDTSTSLLSSHQHKEPPMGEAKRIKDPELRRQRRNQVDAVRALEADPAKARSQGKPKGRLRANVLPKAPRR